MADFIVAKRILIVARSSPLLVTTGSRVVTVDLLPDLTSAAGSTFREEKRDGNSFSSSIDLTAQWRVPRKAPLSSKAMLSVLFRDMIFAVSVGTMQPLVILTGQWVLMVAEGVGGDKKWARAGLAFNSNLNPGSVV